MPAVCSLEAAKISARGALDLFEDGEICRIFGNDKQLEVAWWPQMNGWAYLTPTLPCMIAR